MQKLERRIKRKKRVRSKVFGTGEKPRLSVFRSNKHVFVQLIDDEKGKTLIFANDLELKKGSKDSAGAKSLVAGLVGELLAKKAIAKKIKKIVFDKGSYKYHGRVKELAEGARKGGLEF